MGENYITVVNPHFQDSTPIFGWLIAIFFYELLTLLPEPWGYFNYGWWGVKHTILADPLLLAFTLNYYKLIRKFEITRGGK